MAGNEVDIWLSERYPQGNWFDVAEDDQIPSAITGGFRTILHMFQLFFAPEIRGRMQDGLLDKGFVLLCAQVLLIDDKENEVRLNDEVRGLATVKVDRPVVAGEQVTFSELRGLQEFDLEPAELDYGHFTIFWTGDKWGAYFDFRRGRAKVVEMLNIASEFLGASYDSVEKGSYRAAIDTLFSACEIVAKGILVLHPGKRSMKSHRNIQTMLNQASQLGNVDQDFTRLYNGLSERRRQARYGTGDIEAPSVNELQLVSTQLEALRQAAEQRISSD